MSRSAKPKPRKSRSKGRANIQDTGSSGDSLARRLLKWLLKLAVAALILAFPAITAYHWSEGASLEDAARLTTWDVRFAAKCYAAPETIPRFITKNSFEGVSPGVALSRRGETVGEYLDTMCNDLRFSSRIP
ncbi:MAG: hypothetical protein HW388_380 [Dehalococcoidia bacterium]|nr:hypothetical protein [Dehalococcoidia bacterium]